MLIIQRLSTLMYLSKNEEDLKILKLFASKCYVLKENGSTLQHIN
jgi:hypothetical protein